MSCLQMAGIRPPGQQRLTDGRMKRDSYCFCGGAGGHGYLEREVKANLSDLAVRKKVLFLEQKRGGRG